MDRSAVFVADLAGFEPAVQHSAVGAGVERDVPGDVGALAREQQRYPVRPSVEHPALLLTDCGLKFFVDGNGGFSFHLGVDVMQVGGALPVMEQTVEPE
jgi:hypothetical protein